MPDVRPDHELRVRSVLRPWFGQQGRRVARHSINNRWRRLSGQPTIGAGHPSGTSDAAPPGVEIDAVVTWVDDTDPEWRRRRSEASDVGNEARSPHAVGDARFRSHDELRFLLRALDETVPWLRSIFLVTDGQRPAWLRDNARLRIVHHNAFFADRNDLPTFNSHAIEASLWRMEGLGDRWIYFNDDVIPLRPMQPADFFDASDRPLVQFSGPSRSAHPLATDLALRNVDAVISGRFGVRADRKVAHVAHAQSRRIWESINEADPALLADVARRRFRSPRDVAPIALHHWWGVATGQAAPTNFDAQYVEVTDFGSRRSVLNALADPSIRLLCANRAGDDASARLDRRARRAIGALSTRYPDISHFELPQVP